MSQTGESDLHVLLAHLNPEMQEGVFVFCTISGDQNLPADLHPLLQFREDEGTTVILPREDADAAGLDYTYLCRQITLTVHSDLTAVGLLARITTLLAQAGISVNVISGYYHDHLFVPVDAADAALELLKSFEK